MLQARQAIQNKMGYIRDLGLYKIREIREIREIRDLGLYRDIFIRDLGLYKKRFYRSVL